MNQLPENSHDAIKAFIRLSEIMVTLGERETQALIQNKLQDFANLQREKEGLAARYAKTSEEFQNRLREFQNEDFKATAKNEINTLEALQIKIGELTRSNTVLVDRIFNKPAESNTPPQNNLLFAQEMASAHNTHQQKD